MLLNSKSKKHYETFLYTSNLEEDMKYLFIQEYPLTYLQENIELVIYSVICFFVPFLIGQPQLLVGTIVNASLILAALNFKIYKTIPIIVLPSLAVLTKGLIFGPFTIFLLYMIPFIWVGNAILVFTFKKFNLQKKMNKWITLLFASAFKTAFLFSIAYLFVKISLLPTVFLTAMGLFQFYTAIMGGILAFSIHSAKKRYIQ